MWHIVVTSIRHASDVTLYCLRQLMTPFQQDSDSFYGDMGQVKVAVRRDCSGVECERLRQLAQQVRASVPCAACHVLMAIKGCLYEQIAFLCK